VLLIWSSRACEIFTDLIQFDFPFSSTKFPEVAAQLTETRYIKRPPTADQETKPHDKPNKHPVDTGKFAPVKVQKPEN